MKKSIFITLALLMVAAITTIAQDSKTEKFKVNGQCEMCEERIENAAKAIDGVTAASWDKKSQMLEVTYGTGKVEVKKIHEAVAAVGHDTDLVKADNKVYDALPGCCKYRNVSKKGC